jgi:hypothetical protein
MGYESKPFDRDSFVQITSKEDEDDEDMQLQVENVIRWRKNPMNPVL